MSAEAPKVDVPSVASVIPQWAKFLAALSAVAIILTGIGGAYGIAWARRLCLDSVDPAYINATLKSIGNFPADTTAFYHPVTALRLPRMAGFWNDFSLVSFDQGKNKIKIDLASYHSETSDPDPDEIIDFCYEQPAAFSSMTARFESIVDKGKTSINGHDFVYRVVILKEVKDVSGAKGESYKGLIGCLTIGSKVIAVEAALPASQPFDINLIADFLRKAQSF